MTTLTGPRRDAASGAADALVILLHGFGADGNDLIGLADPLTPHLPNVTFVAPNAPQKCSVNPMGYQWFPIPWMDGSSEVEMGQGFAASTDMLNRYLDEMAKEFPADRTVLVGFSQGTMMSLHVGPQRAQQLAGIVGFSGRLMRPESLADAVSKPPVQLIHGDSDEVVPPASMPEAEKALKSAGFDVQSHVSPGVGHGIAPDGLSLALQRIQGWLS
ncbi:alpha/beta hydrolase [Pontivivens nitratireducens]|uniref:Prolyl oligopeptidase family serine peptidase n=1 Tax=Pontivivens nitratireducens TaxID=2758038 RepID=A0A6G7VLC5_9RHOB|nr:alpha/beta fold hydrolase [Pontibrevibacter nitratireducens]QIK40839.1 prolyl oligopeptidase family serine peptidase [Pontibrevibacter nitratireducens]